MSQPHTGFSLALQTHWAVTASSKLLLKTCTQYLGLSAGLLQAEATDEPLHVAEVVMRPAAVQQVEECWRRLKGKSLYASSKEYLQLVEQVGECQMFMTAEGLQASLSRNCRFRTWILQQHWFDKSGGCQKTISN